MPHKMTPEEMAERITMLERIILDYELFSRARSGSICYFSGCDTPGNPDHPHYVRHRPINYDVPQIYLR